MDRTADALYVRLNDERIVESEEVQPGVILDFSEAGTVVGFEMLGISKRMSADEMQRIEFVTV